MIDIRLRALRPLPCMTAAIVGLAACAGGEADRDTLADTVAMRAGDTTATGGARPARVAAVEGFKTPESVLYDAELDVYFVSNINGNPSAKDGNGFIARISAEGLRVDTMFIAGGKQNATLHAPKGMAVRGDTLWVTDIDALRAFNKRTGAPITSVDFGRRNALFLNDVTIGGDGAIYITDTAIRFSESGEMSHPRPDRIFKLGPGRQITVAAESDSLGRPNGITWDSANNRFIVVSFGAPSIFAWQPASNTRTTIATGPGSFDGVEMTGDGRALISSWADSTIHQLQGGRLTPLITGVPSPADIGIDTKRHRVLVPLFMDDRVEMYELRR